MCLLFDSALLTVLRLSNIYKSISFLALPLESSLRKSHIASFVTLLRNMIMPSSVNQDALLRENAVATLGLLLQNVSGHLLDCNVLMALQLCVADVTVAAGLTTSAAASSLTLLRQLYQYLLFDFRIWNRSAVDVRKGGSGVCVLRRWRGC